MKRKAFLVVACLSLDACLRTVVTHTQQPSTPVLGAVGLPAVLHECDVNCITLQLENKGYVVLTRYPWDHYPGPIVWRVESWTSKSIRLHRTYPSDQVFEGGISAEGNSLQSVSVNGTLDPKVRIAWGSALNSVYGSNQERDGDGGRSHLPVDLGSSQSTPSLPDGNFASIRTTAAINSESDAFAAVCPNSSGSADEADPDKAWQEGMRLSEIEGDGFYGTTWGHTPEALASYCKASAAGSAVADDAIGDIMFEGYSVNSQLASGRLNTTHVPPNRAAAFYFYRRAAQRGYSGAIMAAARMYAAGPEISNNPLQRDVIGARNLLEEAARRRDTDALDYLSRIYSGRAPGWLAKIPPRDDVPANQNIVYANEKMNLLLAFWPRCQEHADEMAAQVPGQSQGRSRVALPIVVRYGVYTEIVCILSLSRAPIPEHETMLSQFKRVMSGGEINNWKFRLIRTPTNPTFSVHRELTAEAIEEAIDETNQLLNLATGK